MIEEKLEEKIHRTDRKLAELLIRLEQIQQQHHEIINDLNATPEDLIAFSQNRDNFSAETWEQLQEEKKQIEQWLHLQLSNVRDPCKAKKATDERAAVQQHWLFVR